MQFIDLKQAYLRQKEAIDQAVMRVLEHGRYVMGPEIQQLERKLAEFVGVKHCIATSNGTSALGVALMALNVGPGDEVITCPFSFFASCEVIALFGATPVFVDIDPATYNIDADLIEAAITDKTKAIMPVSLYGQCAQLNEINAIATKYNLPVIEDAAQSFGATHFSKRSCSLTTIACTSFFPSKPLGCYGDGGACFTNDDELAEKLRSICNHGQRDRYEHVRLGINGRLDSIQAAVLLEKMKIFSDEVQLRQEVAALYQARLPESLSPPTVLEHNTSVYAQYTIQVDNREKVQQLLKERGIPTAVHYPKGLHQQSAILDLGHEYPAFKHTEAAAAKVLSLPFYPYMPLKEIEAVVAGLEALKLIEVSV